MPAPFPGMDPFIEFQIWDEFHSSFIYDLGDRLVPQVRPQYVVRRERRVYVETDPDDPDRYIIPDAALLRPAGTGGVEKAAVSSAAIAATAELTLPMPVTHREAFLTVRDADSLEVVTAIELLSPANKRRGSDGRKLYLQKRDAVLQSTANLVEIDLLRGGDRLPTVGPLPDGDYFVFIARGRRRPRAEVYAWRLRDPLPTIPIPLKGDDPDVTLDLQTIFADRFDRSGYDYSLKYDVSLDPVFDTDDAGWVQEILKQKPT